MENYVIAMKIFDSKANIINKPDSDVLLKPYHFSSCLCRLVSSSLFALFTLSLSPPFSVELHCRRQGAHLALPHRREDVMRTHSPFAAVRILSSSSTPMLPILVVYSLPPVYSPTLKPNLSNFFFFSKNCI